MQTSDVDQVIILNPDTDVMALDSIYLIHLKKGCRPGSLQPFFMSKKKQSLGLQKIILFYLLIFS